MSPNFKVVSDAIRGSVTVTDNTQYNDIDVDDLIVSENISVRLFGNVRKTLVLKKGARVVLHGTLYGDVKNEGGELSIFSRDQH